MENLWLLNNKMRVRHKLFILVYLKWSHELFLLQGQTEVWEVYVLPLFHPSPGHLPITSEQIHSPRSLTLKALNSLSIPYSSEPLTRYTLSNTLRLPTPDCLRLPQTCPRSFSAPCLCFFSSVCLEGSFFCCAEQFAVLCPMPQNNFVHVEHNLMHSIWD